MTNVLAAPDKTQIRRTLRARRNAVSEAARNQAARAICEMLLAHLPAPRGIVAVYLATPRELSLAPFIEAAHERDWNLAAPSGEISGDDFVRLSPENTLVSEQAETEEITVFLVPGIGFDKCGTRLGQGGGWYDRALQNARGVFVGIAFDEQIEENLPREPHDIPVHFLCTPTRWIRCQESTVEFDRTP